MYGMLLEYSCYAVVSGMAGTKPISFFNKIYERILNDENNSKERYSFRNLLKNHRRIVIIRRSAF